MTKETKTTKRTAGRTREGHGKPASLRGGKARRARPRVSAETRELLVSAARSALKGK